ncbi:hypothetical protein Csa_018200 [Cucumis sativus]|uniref:Uncharacterized protein n=1 Tax=Cucumis sativus TaxID=3659 RepID=A0A0A0K6W5_CUCSA|nr:hypothetical protein Csa_018200 [Cucumis sativus]
MNSFAGNHNLLISSIQFNQKTNLEQHNFQTRIAKSKAKYLQASRPQTFSKSNANPILVQPHSL